MENSLNDTFPGQQEGEKILSVITPHQSAFVLEYFKLVCVSLLILVGFISLQKISPIFITVGILFSLFTLIIGFFLYRSLHAKRIAYLTDRRLVRFEPSNVFVVNSRSLTWDNTLKVKTFPTNLLWRLKNIGTVIVHSKTTSTSVNSPDQVLLSNDDIVLKNVYYYKDLGNYIDKILYLYEHNSKELENIHPFVNKPKGQRY
jgi:hypothetical protein